eukprot:413905-Pleurochrysis_carterae.AAC.1
MKAKSLNSPTRLRSKAQQEDDNADDNATEAEAGQLEALQLAYDTAYKECVAAVAAHKAARCQVQEMLIRSA